MRSRELAVDGALEFVPDVFSDHRGLVAIPFQQSIFAECAGHPLFPVAQMNHSVSRRDVLRGLHFTVTPPGMAKYVYCPRGRALDIIADIRLGSPTFGRTEAVVLDETSCRAVYLPVGVGHSYVALEDDTAVCYLLSTPYLAEYECSISPVDPGLGLPLPDDVEFVMSERDTAAPGLAEAERRGMLPVYAECREIEESMWAEHIR